MIVIQIIFALITFGAVGISFALLYETKNLPVVLGVIGLIAIGFGYLAARVTLRLTRDVLALQKQFIGNIAHELRSPLSIIKTNTELAMLDPTIGPDLKKALVSNGEEVDRASGIISNLVSLAALSQPLHIEFSSVNLSSVATLSLKKLAPLARRAHIDIVVRETPGAYVWGNANALEQIVNNLVKNAIQHTSHGGQIDVTIEPSFDTNHTELTIKDSGIGIAREDLFHIFEPFYRAKLSRAQVRDGSGLGLTIVSELVKAHGGKITVRSSPGHGTMIWVLLPNKEIGKVAEHIGDENVAEVSLDFLHRVRS